MHPDFIRYLIALVWRMLAHKCLSRGVEEDDTVPLSCDVYANVLELVSRDFPTGLFVGFPYESVNRELPHTESSSREVQLPRVAIVTEKQDFSDFVQKDSEAAIGFRIHLRLLHVFLQKQQMSYSIINFLQSQIESFLAILVIKVCYIDMRKDLYADFFEKKKVTVMGLGLLGRGIGDTLFLARNGADLTVTDKKTKEELISSVQAVEGFPNITLRLGEHRMEDFEKRDFILKAAGVPLESEYIAHARVHNIPVYMSAALVVQLVRKHLPNVKIVGVTGTRGKSTTTELIAHILEESGKVVHRGGNIRGVANLPLLETIEDGDYLVLELDSWQLQGFDDLAISPDVAIFTSFLDDHMNYYKGDKERYFRDKASIFLHQREGGVLIASEQASEEIRKRHDVEVIVPELQRFETQLVGKHNIVMLSLGYEACVRLGIEEEDIRNAIATFKPVEGRLEYMGMFKDVYVYNDNNATTPDAVVAALDAILEKYNKAPILICGGSDKGLPVVSLEESLGGKTKACVFLSGSGTDTLTVEKTYLFEKLEDCVQQAFQLAESGDVIVFSPGFASFNNYFKNEYERNDAFVHAVKTYL